MTKAEIVDSLLELRFSLLDGELATYAFDYDNATGVCDRVINELDLLMKEI